MRWRCGERWSETKGGALSHSLSSLQWKVLCYLQGWLSPSVIPTYSSLFLLPFLIFCFSLFFRLSLFLSNSLSLLSLLPFFFLPFFPIIIPQLLISKLHDFQRLVPLATPLQAHHKPFIFLLPYHYSKSWICYGKTWHGGTCHGLKDRAPGESIRICQLTNTSPVGSEPKALEHGQSICTACHQLPQ